MNIYSQITANKAKSWLIIILFVIFITTLVYIFGRAQGSGLAFAGIALVISGIMSLGSYYYSDKLILTMANAHEIKKKDSPELFRIVENLAIGDGVPVPKVYIADDPTPNAFATGRDPQHAVVCVNQGLLERLNKVELEGVIAHELSHVKNYDTRLMSIVIILVGMVSILADIFLRSLWFRNDDNDSRGNSGAVFMLIGVVLAIISPLIAMLIQLAVSRKREFLADASGALLTRYPQGLASALEKISQNKRPSPTANNATSSLYIVNPFTGKEAQNWFSGLFNTHPPVEERIKILRAM